VEDQSVTAHVIHKTSTLTGGLPCACEVHLQDVYMGQQGGLSTDLVDLVKTVTCSKASSLPALAYH
jgi:hypothetical protein